MKYPFAPSSRTDVAVVDPASAELSVAILALDEHGLASLTGERLLRAGETPPALCIGPGWVDAHAHVYDGTTELGLRPDRVGLDHGVHTIVDAGSAGEATLRGLTEYVIPSAATSIKALLNIGSHGLVHLKEVSDSSFIDVAASIRAVESAPHIVRGIKVRSSGEIVGNMGVQPLQLGKLVARECGLPLMVHIGEAPPAIDDVLNLLDAGDTITHCFHGKIGFPWLPDGRPSPALESALDRGVRLDVGHGAASFDIRVASAAVRAGFEPHSISTDIHVRSIMGPVFDIATVMTKLLYCGMDLLAVIRAVTDGPRSFLQLDEPWRDVEGALSHATLFSVEADAPMGRRYVDAQGNTLVPERHLIAQATISAGGAIRTCP